MAKTIPKGLAELRGTSPGLKSSARARMYADVWLAAFDFTAAGLAAALALGAELPPTMSCASTTLFASASPTAIASRSSLIASILLPRLSASRTWGGSELRSAMPRILSLAAALACTLAFAADPPARRQSEIERVAVGCAANPSDHRIASRAELARLLAAWEKDCRGDGDRKRKADFLRVIDDARIDFAREALFILGGFYGTGMARASLDLSADGSVLTAAIRWRVPPPPVTPDTATYRFAFTVDKARISQVRITVDGREKAVLSTNPEDR